MQVLILHIYKSHVQLSSKFKMVCKGDTKWVWVNIYKHRFAKKILFRHWTTIKVT